MTSTMKSDPARPDVRTSFSACGSDDGGEATPPAGVCVWAIAAGAGIETAPAAAAPAAAARFMNSRRLTEGFFVMPGDPIVSGAHPDFEPPASPGADTLGTWQIPACIFKACTP